jgi:hypothetical protein
MPSTRIRPLRRAADLISDAVLVLWCLLWAGVAWALKSVVDALAVPAEGIGRTAGDLAGRVDDAADRLGDVALVGDELARPFSPIADGLRQLSAQSVEQAEAVYQAGWLLFLVVFLIPSLTLALLYLPRRVRRAKESAAARRYIDSAADLDLFALRALANSPMTQLAEISPDPVADWRSGDRAVITALANLELRRVGIGTLNLDQPTGSGQ